MQSKPYRVLLALSDFSDLKDWVKLAWQMVQPAGEIEVRGLVTVAQEKSLSEGANIAREWRDALDSLSADDGTPAPHATAVLVDYSPMSRLMNDIGQAHIDLLLVQWNGIEDLTANTSTDDILQYAPCDVVLIHGKPWAQKGPVLLSLRGGPNASLGLHVSKALADGEPITLFHAADPKQVTNLRPLTLADPRISRTVTATTGFLEGIVREASSHKMVVMGASSNKFSPATSEFIKQVDSHTKGSLVLVRALHPEALVFHAPRWPLVVEESLSTKVDRWFAETTFHHSEFADVKALLALKQAQGVTISVGLPALNEEETIGKVIEVLKKALMDDVPLVDEIVLIDSNSTDRTVEIAESFGIPVFKHPDILPEVGSYRGKGEALWKSLHVLKGDIIVWVDTDITNIDPLFVYGLLGPLLRQPQIQYVKGFYRRPIKVGEKVESFGGGRVTELVARPLLNLFYPELSGVVQPLSGEYAGRRTALEQVPFFSGYGVETALLIDILDRFGLEAMAQTDLELRIHYNQPLVDLSKMSFAILQVFVARLENRYGVELLDKANRTMKLIVHEPDRFALDIVDISDQQRPPMIEIPAYRDRLGRAGHNQVVTRNAGV
ncbi:MAG: glucosyl-3-phosphoglycerate synthase [Chloroflexota bacterium]